MISAHSNSPPFIGRGGRTLNSLINHHIGFVGIAGIQRFILGEIGMGYFIVYVAFGFIGTIIDLVNYRNGIRL
jgi:TM2 domain-containing membrane protein YozV